MKKFFRGLIIFLVISIILPIALAFIFLFDTGKMKVKYDKDFNQDKFTESLVVDSLDSTVDQKVAKFRVTESDINNMLYQGLKDNKEANEYITQLAVDITNNSYVINVSGKFYFFETRAQITAKLSKKQIKRSGELVDAYVFEIKNVTLGRLTQLKDVIMFFLKQFLNQSTLDALTKSLNIHTDLQKEYIYIYASDLRDALNDVVDTGDGVSEFYFTFINDFLDHNLLEFDFYDDEALSINIKLEPLTGNDYGEGQYVAYNMPYENTLTKLTINGEQKKLSLDVIKEALVVLLNEGKMVPNQLAIVSDYLFNGYRPGVIPSDMDLSPIGINDKTTYLGFNLMSPVSMDGLLTDAVSSFADYDDALDSFDIVNLKEEDVNNYLRTQSMFGNKYFLHREIADGSHKVSYIALDNAYINLLSNKAIITAGLNINGLETIITLPMLLDEERSSGTKLVYDAEALYYGATMENGEKLTLQEDTEQLIFDTLKDSVRDDSFFFVGDGKLTIDFGAVINGAISAVNTGNPIYDAAYKEFLSSHADYKIQVVGDSVEDNSTINIKANRRP
ncbi:MAG: hypothetical protein J5617_00570 [Bacilli bacterium]|nr:hypothetical protein [Bacilli bacterium]